MIAYHHPAYFVPLPEGHPFPIFKYQQARDLLRPLEARGLLQIEQPHPVSWEEITRTHDSEYLEAVRDDQLSRYARNRLGLPHHPRFIERSLLDVAGTLQASRIALKEGCAWNLGGGTHHAMPAEGLGFCVTNDVAAAIRILRPEYPDLNILVLDTDAHQGNGNHFILRDDPLIFTYSIHVGRNYPSQKCPGDMDVEMDRYASGNAYLAALEHSLAELENHFEPDLVYWISGVDVLEADRFGQLRLSEADMQRRNQIVMEFIHRWGAAWVGTFGGGYHLDTSKIAAYHAEIVEQTLS